MKEIMFERKEASKVSMFKPDDRKGKKLMLLLP
jgi:hypothetical protein